MKYLKFLSVNGKPVNIVSDSWMLEAGSPGRAILAVNSEQLQDGLATFDLGLDGAAERWFTGYVEQCLRIDARQVRLTVRELGAVLAARWPLSMRNVTARDILSSLAAKTGLTFTLENASWTAQSFSHFINIGSGYEALDLLGAHLEIDRYRWQCQPDGSIYVGSAAGTAADKKIIALPAEIFTETSAAGAACALLPALRPGQRIRIGDGDTAQINSITVAGEIMRLSWA
ncbi:MAG: hypothetical protein PHH77_03495 [Victivallaceae bacterium]|nr:hypothetical protein [Victivallaceae bacterium]